MKRSDAIAFAATMNGGDWDEVREALASLDERDELTAMLLTVTANHNLLVLAVAHETGKSYETVLADLLDLITHHEDGCNCGQEM